MSMRPAPDQVLVNLAWIWPPVRRSPSTMAIQRPSRRGSVTYDAIPAAENG
jgi:hypothetical protein